MITICQCLIVLNIYSNFVTLLKLIWKLYVTNKMEERWLDISFSAMHYTTLHAQLLRYIYCYSVSKEGHVNNKNGVSNLNIKIIYLKLNYISNCQRYPSFFTNPDNGTQSQTRCAPDNLPCRTFPELCLDCDPFVQCCLQKSRLLLQKGVMFSLQHLKRNKTFKYGIPMLVSIILILYKLQ